MKGDKGISAFPDGDNIFKWIGTIQGPEGTVSLMELAIFIHYILSTWVTARVNLM